MKYFRSIVITTIFVILIPVIAFADEVRSNQDAFRPIANLSRSCYAQGNCTLCDLLDTFSSVAEWLIGIVGSVALLTMVWFGLQLLLPNNASEGIKTAKTGIVAATTGLVVTLGAWTFMNWGLAFLLNKTTVNSNHEQVLDYRTPKLFAGDKAWYEICQGIRERKVAGGEYDKKTLGYECFNDGGRCGFKASPTTDCQSGPCFFGVCNKPSPTTKAFCTINENFDKFTSQNKIVYESKFNTWCYYKYGGYCVGIKSTKGTSITYEKKLEMGEKIINSDIDSGICPLGSVCFAPTQWSVSDGLDKALGRSGGCEAILSSEGCNMWQECQWTLENECKTITK